MDLIDPVLQFKNFSGVHLLKHLLEVLAYFKVDEDSVDSGKLGERIGAIFEKYLNIFLHPDLHGLAMLNSSINLAKISIKIFLPFLGLNFMLLEIINMDQIIIDFMSNSIQLEQTLSNPILGFHPVILDIFFNGLDPKRVDI